MEIIHPRLQKQKEDRINTLAEFQYSNGLSREEMQEHFTLLAEAKSHNFDSIEAYLENRKPATTTIFNSADQVLKQLSGGNRKK